MGRAPGVGPRTPGRPAPWARRRHRAKPQRTPGRHRTSRPSNPSAPPRPLSRTVRPAVSKSLLLAAARLVSEKSWTEFSTRASRRTGHESGVREPREGNAAPRVAEFPEGNAQPRWDLPIGSRAGAGGVSPWIASAAHRARVLVNVVGSPRGVRRSCRARWQSRDHRLRAQPLLSNTRAGGIRVFGADPGVCPPPRSLCRVRTRLALIAKLSPVMADTRGRLRRARCRSRCGQRRVNTMPGLLFGGNSHAAGKRQRWGERASAPSDRGAGRRSYRRGIREDPGGRGGGVRSAADVRQYLRLARALVARHWCPGRSPAAAADHSRPGAGQWLN